MVAAAPQPARLQDRFDVSSAFERQSLRNGGRIGCEPPGFISSCLPLCASP